MKKKDWQELIDCVSAILDLVPKSRKLEALANANAVFLQLEKGKREAKE